MDIQIVSSQVGHAEDIVHICATGWRQTVENQPLTAKEKDEIVKKWYNIGRVKEDIQKESYTLTALIEEKIVGVIGGQTVNKVSEIWVLYVDKNYRYRGIGKKLVNKLTDLHIKSNAKVQRVSVVDKNQYGIPFYESIGFLQKGKKKIDNQVINKYQRNIKK